MSQSRQDSHWPKMGQFEHQKELHIQYVKIYKIIAMLKKKKVCECGRGRIQGRCARKVKKRLEPRPGTLAEGGGPGRCPTRGGTWGTS